MSKKKPRSRKRLPGAKKPAIGPFTPSGKSPRSREFSLFDGHPSWRLSRAESQGPFGWHGLTKDEAVEIHSKLRGFESMTWHEILIDSKKRNHTVSVDQISSVARKRLIDLKLDDRESLISLRLGGAERLWGFREGDAFVVVWWDPHHQVYPTQRGG